MRKKRKFFMKKLAILLGLAATCSMFVGCSNYYGSASEQPAAAPSTGETAPAPAPVHHDYKGEK